LLISVMFVTCIVDQILFVLIIQNTSSEKGNCWGLWLCNFLHYVVTAVLISWIFCSAIYTQRSSIACRGRNICQLAVVTLQCGFTIMPVFVFMWQCLYLYV